MDFRMRNLKENKQNYNSMVEFPRNTVDYTHSPTNADFSNPKIKQLQIRLANLSDSFRLDSENNGLQFARLEQRLEQLQHRAPSLDPLVSRINSVQKNDGRERSIAGNGQEMAYFKQGMLGELGAIRQQIRGQGLRSEQVEARQSRLEQELREWIGQQKQEISIKLLSQAEEIRGTDIGRQRKYDGQLDSLRAALSAIQDDLNDKMRAMGSLKQEFGSGLQAVKDSARGDKEALARLVKQVKESFQALREAISKDRQYVKEAIFEIQSSSQDSFNKSTRSIDCLAQSWNERQEKIEKRLVGLKDQWGAFKLTCNQKIEDCKSLIVNIETNTLEQLEALKGKSMGGDLEALKEQLEEWKRLTEQKNLNVFREISNAMKVLRMEWHKQSEELSKQQEETVKSLKQVKHSLTDRLEREMAAFTQLSHQQFDAITGQLEQANDLIALSNKELKASFWKQVNAVTETVNALSSEMQKKVGVLEESTKKQLVQTTNNLRLQLQKVEKTLNVQFEGLVSSITEDNQQWAKEMNETAKKLKEGYTKDIQVAIQIQKEQFIQQNKKLQTSFQTIQKGLESRLTVERNETVKQLSKTTEEITGLINDWVTKSKKERQGSQKELKDTLSQQKKSVELEISNAKLLIEEMKKNASQKAAQDLKKSTELRSYVEQTLTKAAKTSEEEQAKNNKRIDTLKLQLEGKVKAVSQKILLDINMKKEFEAKAKEEESKAKTVEIDKKIADVTAKVKADMQADLNKVTKNAEEESSKINKKIETMSATFKKEMQTEIDKDKKFCIDEIAKAKGEIQIKMKAKDEKYLNQINSKREAQLKQKDDELKIKLTEVQKKINDSSAKTKSEIIGQVNKTKAAHLEELNKIKNELENKIKAFEELKSKKQADSKVKEGELKEKENELKNRSLQQDKKIESIKKLMQNELEKSKKYYLDELSKAKTEMEGKGNAKKDAEAKQNQEELKARMAEMDKKITDASTKNKSQIMAELSKSQQQVTKIKNEIDNKIKAFEELKSKKEADSKAKEDEIKNKEAELKARSAELDKKIEIAKKEINKSATEEINKLKVDFDSKINALNNQVDGKIKIAVDSAGKGSIQDKQKFTELSGKVQLIKGEMEKRLGELKGAALVNLKNHQQQCNKLQDQKLESLKAYFTQTIQTSNAATVAALKGRDDKISKAITETEKIRLEMNSTKEWLNKVESKVASQSDKNKAVYDKMTSDILDVADSITVIISELKAPQK